MHYSGQQESDEKATESGKHYDHARHTNKQDLSLHAVLLLFLVDLLVGRQRVAYYCCMTTMHPAPPYTGSFRIVPHRRCEGGGSGRVGRRGGWGAEHLALPLRYAFARTTLGDPPGFVLAVIDEHIDDRIAIIVRDDARRGVRPC